MLSILVRAPQRHENNLVALKQNQRNQWDHEEGEQVEVLRN